ncbi:aminoglycoside phosphotransferase family protein [Allonocardiopsis opalescens]|uniref:Aminoglycoside phosphotransferase (APT) family kinase protein n=1 Tax=Allonocardiopsis opalescens TaxID=1144618 RepID=A0A2T0PZ88_9ACTN|nr:aminoglycoside phosphotransferase family protein [Allonocardiopsis opalescens]PRX96841.1 aminoglycoside phosphotransferase (APT) family kinase protein [Allonocardiopsis opalescens]
MPEITAELVRTLIAAQFPQWSGLPIVPVERQGWDNRTFRLGDELAVRLPSGESYAAAVAKEDRWLPVLAKALPLPVPEVVATGRPGGGYPFPWSVRRWMSGETLADAHGVDRTALARDLGAFLTALRAVPATRGPAAGRHCYWRGCHPSVYGDQVQDALVTLEDEVDAAACEDVWARALTSAWPQAPVWFHGDVAAGNLLAAGGGLSAVIDFGTCGVGDPACDLVMAWTYFEGHERQVFREAAGLSDDTWRRARGWALWKALATMGGLSSPDPDGFQNRVLAEVLADPVVD